MLNLRKVRQCPECGSKNWERTLAYTVRTVSVDGKVTRMPMRSVSDMGNFDCKDCGFYERLA